VSARFIIIGLILCLSSHAYAQDGSLDATSEPPGATIRVDAIAIGTTPCIISLSPGIYEITAEKDGYVSETASITIASGVASNHNFRLRLLPTSVTIETIPDGAKVTMTGVGLNEGKSYNATTPATIDNVASGDYMVLLRKTHFDTVEKAIKVTSKPFEATIPLAESRKHQEDRYKLIEEFIYLRSTNNTIRDKIAELKMQKKEETTEMPGRSKKTPFASVSDKEPKYVEPKTNYYYSKKVFSLEDYFKIAVSGTLAGVLLTSASVAALEADIEDEYCSEFDRLRDQCIEDEIEGLAMMGVALIIGSILSPAWSDEVWYYETVFDAESYSNNNKAAIEYNEMLNKKLDGRNSEIMKHNRQIDRELAEQNGRIIKHNTQIQNKISKLYNKLEPDIRLAGILSKIRKNMNEIGRSIPEYQSYEEYENYFKSM
jgi:hypothetical protein